MFNNDTLRGKLLKFILSLTLISISLVILYGFHYVRKKDEINNIIDRINKLNITLIMDVKCQTDFIKYDAVDTNFHITRKSVSLEKHKKLRRNIDEIINSFNRDDTISGFNIQHDLDSLKVILNEIDKEFANIIIDIQKRGFKDFGIEGGMRTYAHLLEKSQINPTMVLSLRRHEKDYIIRKEPQYIDQLNQQGIDLRRYIDTHSLSSQYRDSINGIVNKYLSEFNKMVGIEEEIGLYGKKGLIQNLELNYIASARLIEHINNNAYQEKNEMFRVLKMNTIWFLLILVSTIITASIYLSKYITDPLKILTTFISSVTENNFRFQRFPEFGNPGREITILIAEFKNMLLQLQTHEKERNIAETALRENETRYKNLADMLPQCVFETDHNCKLTYFNKTLAETFITDSPVSENELNLSEILLTDCEILMEPEYSSGIPYVAHKRNGEHFPVLLYSSRIIRNNILVGLRGIMVDITEKKRCAEEIKEKKTISEQVGKSVL